MDRSTPGGYPSESDAAIVARVKRFSAYLCEPGVLRTLRFLYRHRVISRREWLLAVWAVGTRLRETEPEMSEGEIIELMKQVFDAHEVDSERVDPAREAKRSDG